jgi:hypothetical protein
MKFLKKGKAKANEANGEDHGDAKNPESQPEQAPQAKIEAPAVVHKFGIADRLNDGVIARSTSSEKRSPDLVPLSKEFDVIRKQLRQLNISAQQYHDSLCKMNKQRSMVRISLLPVTLLRNNDCLPCFFAHSRWPTISVRLPTDRRWKKQFVTHQTRNPFFPCT